MGTKVQNPIEMRFIETVLRDREVLSCPMKRVMLLRWTYHPLVPQRLEIFELPLGGVVALGVGFVEHLGSANPDRIWKISHSCLGK